MAVASLSSASAQLLSRTFKTAWFAESWWLSTDPRCLLFHSPATASLPEQIEVNYYPEEKSSYVGVSLKENSGYNSDVFHYEALAVFTQGPFLQPRDTVPLGTRCD